MSSMIGRLVSDLGSAAGIVIVVGGVLGAGRAAIKWYGRTIGSRRDLARRLNQLACGVTVRYVEERFGTPAFARAFAPAMPLPAPPAERSLSRVLVRALGDSRTPEPSLGGVIPVQRGVQDGQATERKIRELIFRERHAWVQVLADDNDAVVRFSTTVTDPKFQFSAEPLTWGHLQVRLGKSTFADVNATCFGRPEGRSLRVGAHNREYAESYYFGNPGQYQHYVLSHNELGTGKFGPSMESAGGPSFFRTGALANERQPERGIQPEFDAEAAYAIQFRAGTTINTLTVLGPSGGPAGLVEPRGPGSNHVRVLLPEGVERQELRRRIKAIRALRALQR